FKGGTELQLQFTGSVSSGELRQALESFGHHRPDVVAVEQSPNQFIVRVQEVSALTDAQKARIRQAVEGAIGDVEIREMEVSPGGAKVSLQLSGPVPIETLEQAFRSQGI